MTTAVYPGSFDPVTNGHLDIIQRASKFVDKLIVGVLDNTLKNPLFTVDERIHMIQMVTKGCANVEILSFNGLLVDFAREQNANIVIRGLRAVTDFENEFKMALTNRTLNPDVETLFISTSTKYLFLSSSSVKEVAYFNGNIDGMVKPEIKDLLIEKIKKQKPLSNGR